MVLITLPTPTTICSAVVLPYKELKQQLSDQEHSEEQKKFCNDIAEIIFVTNPAGERMHLHFFMSFVL